MKIYTKTGDQGLTSLIGGARVPKDHARIEAYGTLDELNSHLGAAIIMLSDPNQAAFLTQMQSSLFTMGSHLASLPDSKMKLPEIETEWVSQMEAQIDAMDSVLEPLKNFILPGGSKAIAQIHIARCVCRRAERQVVYLGNHEEINPLIITFLNRLSDYLFTLARLQAQQEGVSEIAWKP